MFTFEKTKLAKPVASSLQIDQDVTIKLTPKEEEL